MLELGANRVSLSNQLEKVFQGYLNTVELEEITDSKAVNTFEYKHIDTNLTG